MPTPPAPTNEEIAKQISMAREGIDEDRYEVPSLVIIGHLLRAVEMMHSRQQADQLANHRAANTASCLANGIIPD